MMTIIAIIMIIIIVITIVLIMIIISYPYYRYYYHCYCCGCFSYCYSTLPEASGPAPLARRELVIRDVQDTIYVKETCISAKSSDGSPAVMTPQHSDGQQGAAAKKERGKDTVYPFFESDTLFLEGFSFFVVYVCTVFRSLAILRIEGCLNSTL